MRNEQLMQATSATQKHCGWSKLTGPKCAKPTRQSLGALFERAVRNGSLLYAAEALWIGSEVFKMCATPSTQ